MIASGIYKAGIQFYSAALKLAALAGNIKAQQWQNGRRNWKSRMRQEMAGIKPIVWIHAASLGEFEQGRPLIEAIRQNYPAHKILLTFFSPSGYEVRKDYEGADYVFYLPLDTRRNARDFIDIVQPVLAIFIKYEIWYYYLTTLHQHNVPVLLVSAIFRKDQVFFKTYGGMFRQLLRQLTHIFVQNETSLQLLKSIGITHTCVSGDTRFDRVADLLANEISLPLIVAFAAGQPLLVAGSTWREDEQVLRILRSVPSCKHLKLIIAPHEIHGKHLEALAEMFPTAVKYSALKAGAAASEVLIIDNIGMLTSLYSYATIAYVGGGFGKDGIHNLLEPAAFYKPVIIGPEFKKYAEAVELVKLQGALVITGQTALLNCVNTLLEDQSLYEKTAAIAGNYVAANKGATKRILNYIQEKRFLSKV